VLVRSQMRCCMNEKDQLSDFAMTCYPLRFRRIAYDMKKDKSAHEKILLMSTFQSIASIINSDEEDESTILSSNLTHNWTSTVAWITTMIPTTFAPTTISVTLHNVSRNASLIAKDAKKNVGFVFDAIDKHRKSNIQLHCTVVNSVCFVTSAMSFYQRQGSVSLFSTWNISACSCWDP